MSKKKKHKQKMKSCAIPVDVVIDKVNWALAQGLISMYQEPDGSMRLCLPAEAQNNTEDECNSVATIAEELEYIGEVIGDALSAGFDKLYDQLQKMNARDAVILDKIISDRGKMEVAQAEAAEPIKIFPDDSIRAIVREEIKKMSGVSETNEGKAEKESIPTEHGMVDELAE